jgi:hypothetical protein
MGSQQAQSERLLEPFTERLQALGAAIEGQAEALATNVVTPIMERLASLGSEHKVLAGAVGGQQAQVERLIEQFTQRLEGMAAFIEGQGEAHAAKVASPIVQRLAGLGDVVEKSQAGIGHTLGQFTERLAAVDQSLASCGQQTAELNAAHTRDVRDIREALLTVSGNQQTLASVVDQWRFDTTGDLSIISNRLQALERASLRPELIESLIATVQDLHRLLEEREEESGLRRWLRGTDDGNGAGQGLRAGIKKLAKPSPGSVGSEPSPDGRKSWLRQATEFVRRRRPK